jgi:hypothetical protein
MLSCSPKSGTYCSLKDGLCAKRQPLFYLPIARGKSIQESVTPHVIVRPNHRRKSSKRYLRMQPVATVSIAKQRLTDFGKCSGEAVDRADPRHHEATCMKTLEPPGSSWPSMICARSAKRSRKSRCRAIAIPRTSPYLQVGESVHAGRRNTCEDKVDRTYRGGAQETCTVLALTNSRCSA